MVKLSSLVIATIALTAATAQATIYRWIDKNGNAHFTDRPPATTRFTEVAVHVPPGGRSSAQPAKHADEQRPDSGNRSRAESFDKVTNACQQARVDHYWLDHNLAVYIDADGSYRARYRGDPYQGDRTWLNEAERATALAEANARLNDHCANPQDQEAQDRIAYQVQLAEACTIARARMDAMLSGQSTTADDHIDEHAAIVDRVCDSPA